MVTELYGDFHQPYALLDKNGFPEKYEQCIKYVKQGMKAKEAVLMVFEVQVCAWHQWIKMYTDDVEHGFNAEESNLIKLMNGIAKADLDVRRRLEGRALDMAMDTENPNPDMVKFILERRYDYVKKQKSDVEVGAKKDTTFNINITESKPQDK